MSMTIVRPPEPGPGAPPFVRNDGGREAAGFRGSTGDCACRAVAIATGFSYRLIYDDLIEFARTERPGSKRRSHPRTGYRSSTLGRYLTEQWEAIWTPTMAIGSGCRVHLTPAEVPADGCHIVRLSRHYTALIQGTVNDTYDPSRDGTRCVYGYWTVT